MLKLPPFYVPITKDVSLVDNDLVPLLIQLRWRKVTRIPGEIKILVTYPLQGVEPHILFEVVDGIRFVEDTRRSYFGAVVSLATKHEGKDVFALLEVDLDDFDKWCRIIFSPLPFDGNGKPQLPEDEHFLDAVAWLYRTGLVNSGSWLHETNVIDFLQTNHGMKREAGLELCRRMVSLGIAQGRQNTAGPIQPALTSERFVEIFGDILPKVLDVSAPAKSEDWLPQKFRQEVIVPVLLDVADFLVVKSGQDMPVWGVAAGVWANQVVKHIVTLDSVDIAVALQEIRDVLQQLTAYPRQDQLILCGLFSRASSAYGVAMARRQTS